MSAIANLNAEEARKRFKNIIDVLKYHVATGRFSYVDRIMSAMSPTVVEETVREAIRAALSAASSPKSIRGNLVRYNESKKLWEPQEAVEVKYVEEERLDVEQARRGAIPIRARLHGELLQIGNEWKILYTPPLLPKESELAAFFDEVRRDLNVARLVASLAMTMD
jgi:hypothetical protein